MKKSRLLSAVLGLIAAGALRGTGRPPPAPRSSSTTRRSSRTSGTRTSRPTRGSEAILEQDPRPPRPRGPHPWSPRATSSRSPSPTSTSPGTSSRGAARSGTRCASSRMIYPPAFKFTYSVTDPSGKVVRKGSEDIRDLDFQIGWSRRPQRSPALREGHPRRVGALAAEGSGEGLRARRGPDDFGLRPGRMRARVRPIVRDSVLVTASGESLAERFAQVMISKPDGGNGLAADGGSTNITS